MRNYLNRIDAIERTLSPTRGQARVIVVYVNEGDDAEPAIAEAKRERGFAPDDDSPKLVIVEYVSAPFPLSRGAPT